MFRILSVELKTTAHIQNEDRISKVGTGIQTGGAKGSWTPAGKVERPTAPRGFGDRQRGVILRNWWWWWWW
jgi:hypothetical protein